MTSKHNTASRVIEDLRGEMALPQYSSYLIKRGTCMGLVYLLMSTIYGSQVTYMFKASD